MIERNEQAAAPLHNPGHVFAQAVVVWLDQAQSVERDCAERSDDRRVEQFNQSPQEARTVFDLGARGPVICARWFARAAQDAVGNEDIGAGELNRSQELFKVVARFVAVKWNARAISAIAAWGFGNKKYFRMECAVALAEHGLAVLHAFAGRASGGFSGEGFK